MTANLNRPPPTMKPKDDRRSAAGGRTPTLAIAGLLVAVLLIGIGAALFFTGHRDDGSKVGGAFALVDGDGKRVTDQDFHGKYLLVYFGYTFCPDVCPTTLSAVAEAMDKLGTDGARVQPVFITIDPKRDTPTVVKQYASSFGSHIIGLTGTPDEIAAVARAYRVYYAVHRTGPGPDDYSMDHSSILYLMGPDGQFVEPIRADATASDIATAIRKGMS